MQDATAHRSFLAISFDDDLVGRLGEALQPFGTVLRSDPTPAALQALIRSVRPDAVLLDVCITRTMGGTLPEQIGLIREADAKVRIIAIGDEFAAQMVLLAMRSGAHDFIERDSSHEEFAAQIGRGHANRDERAAPANASGRVVGFFSGRPNDGEAQTALAAALTLAHRNKGRVLYLDLACPCSDIELALDVRPTYGLRQAMNDLSRLDQTLLDGVVARDPVTGLFLLPLALGDAPAEPLRPGTLPALLFVLRSVFSDIVVNFAGPGNGDDLASIMPALAGAVAVVRQDLASLRATGPLVRTLADRLENPGRLAVALVDHDQRISITPEQVTRALGGQRCVVLPDTRVSCQNAIAGGTYATYVRKCSTMAKGTASLLGAIDGDAPSRTAPSAVSRLAGLAGLVRRRHANGPKPRMAVPA